MKTWVCAYCSTINPNKEETCNACGAPFINPEFPAPVVRVVNEKKAESNRTDTEAEQFAKLIRTANAPVDKGLQLYSLFWRTLGEAIAISVACFILGALATATDLAVFGVLVSAVVGFLVGRNNRNFYTVSGGLIAVVIMGILVGIPCWLVGSGPRGLFIVASVLMIAAALGASYKSPPFTKGSTWDKVRPLIGGAGGIIFALIGSALTWSIMALFSVMLQGVSQ